MNLKHLLRTIIQYKYVKIFKNYNNILINIIDSLHLDVIQVNLGTSAQPATRWTHQSYDEFAEYKLFLFLKYNI